MKLFQQMTLAARLGILFGLAAGVVFTAAGVYLFQFSSEQLNRRDDAALMGAAMIVRHYIEGASSIEALRSQSRALLDIALGHGHLAFSIRTREGELVTASTPEASSLPFRASSVSDASNSPSGITDLVTSEGQNARVAVISVRVGSGEERVQLSVARQGKERTEILQAYRRNIVWTALAGVLATALLGYAIARRGLRPIKMIAQASGEITASALGERRLRAEDAPSELEEMVHAFNDMLDRLQDSFSRLSQFSSDIAHDLRTPVSNMMVEMQVALGRQRSTAEYESLIASNLEELERLSRMTKEMLFLARADNPFTVIDKASVNLRAELDKVAELYRLFAHERNLSVECEGDAVIVGDKALLQRAIQNLLSNAVRYASPDGVIRAKIASVAGGRWVELSIANPGPGISREHLSRVFDRFYRTDGARHRSEEGAGLGLAIVKSVVQLHGGEAQVRSDAGTTTTFTIRLPVT